MRRVYGSFLKDHALKPITHPKTQLSSQGNDGAVLATPVV